VASLARERRCRSSRSTEGGKGLQSNADRFPRSNDNGMDFVGLIDLTLDSFVRAVLYVVLVHDVKFSFAGSDKILTYKT
jgi:hypothetical protein